MFDASLPDLLRLVAVPVLGWAAVRDLRTRRVPNETWYPLVAVGALALALDAWAVHTGSVLPLESRLFWIRVATSIGVVVPIAYLLWRVGGFGGADAKAFMALALLFPTYPVFYLPDVALPLVRARFGVFSLTVLTNTVLLGLLYPVALGARNLAAGRLSRAAFVGVPVRWDALVRTHGRLLETESGFTRQGLDLDALRMYLRWRGLSLADVRADPSLRDPATLPDEPGEPTDGAVRTDGGDPAFDDPWGAAAFLASIEGDAYGTTPDQLREGLDLLVDRDVVWVSPGIPFVVPTFLGLVVALIYGDVLVALLDAAGAV